MSNDSNLIDPYANQIESEFDLDYADIHCEWNKSIWTWKLVESLLRFQNWLGYEKDRDISDKVSSWGIEISESVYNALREKNNKLNGKIIYK